MSEDRQPNDLRGRNTTVGIPSIRPARNIPQSRDSPSSARTSFKRPFDRSYTASPAKRRRLEFEPAQREIRRELPPACRKGVPDCHRQRKLFIIHEIECLQKSRLGLTVVSHSVKDGAVFFLCTQADILNCSLAPSSTLNEIPQKEHIQPKVEPLSQNLPPPNPIISTIAGPPRFFKSGTLSFSPDLHTAGETLKERVVVSHPSGAVGADLDHPMPVAELMFGKQGPPKVSPSFAATFSIPSVNCTPASTSGSRTASLKPQPQATASNSVADDERTVASRPSGAFGADLDHPIPVAELMFGKQGPPKSSSAFAATSVSTPSMNCTPASTSGSRTPPTQTTASNPITGDERVVLNRTSRDHPTRPSKPSSSIAAASVSIPSWIVKPAPLQTQTQAIASNTQSLSLSNKVQFGEEPLSESFQPTSSAKTLHIPSTRLPSPSRDLESSLSDYTWEPDGDEFRVPIRQQHDKLRRFLCGTTPSSSVVVSMYGAVENVDVASRKHRLIAQGPSPTKEAVDDACLVTDGNRSVVILGHFRDSQQLSLININNLDNMVSAIDLKRPWNPAKKGGASTVAPMMQPLMFASGGYDHCVHLWTVKDDLSSASPTTLSIKHASQVQSLLAIRDTSHKLVSAGADCNVHIWDLSSERVVHTLKPSNSIYHTHPTTSPFCTLLEVAHRELQFEVRDHRIVNTIPVQRFGYTTLQVHGRFMKGSSFSNCFVSGDKSGYVRLWDLRNIKKPCAEIECFNGQKIAQLVFQSESSRLLACSENNQIRLVKHNRPI